MFFVCVLISYCLFVFYLTNRYYSIEFDFNDGNNEVHYFVARLKHQVFVMASKDSCCSLLD